VWLVRAWLVIVPNCPICGTRVTAAEEPWMWCAEIREWSRINRAFCRLMHGSERRRAGPARERAQLVVEPVTPRVRRVHVDDVAALPKLTAHERRGDDGERGPAAHPHRLAVDGNRHAGEPLRA
jgi:hypothetical protein